MPDGKARTRPGVQDTRLGEELVGQFRGILSQVLPQDRGPGLEPSYHIRIADPHVISALRSKRAELSGELIATEKRILQLRADIDSLDGAIRVFDPTAEPHEIRPVSPSQEIGAHSSRPMQPGNPRYAAPSGRADDGAGDRSPACRGLPDAGDPSLG